MKTRLVCLSLSLLLTTHKAFAHGNHGGGEVGHDDHDSNNVAHDHSHSFHIAPTLVIGNKESICARGLKSKTAILIEKLVKLSNSVTSDVKKQKIKTAVAGFSEMGNLMVKKLLNKE
jgi:hypothetical protein